MMKRYLLVAALAATFLLTASGQTPVAEGSTVTHRTEIDHCYGQIYVYVGGSFPAGTHPSRLQFLFDL